MHRLTLLDCVLYTNSPISGHLCSAHDADLGESASLARMNGIAGERANATTAHWRIMVIKVRKEDTMDTNTITPGQTVVPDGNIR